MKGLSARWVGAVMAVAFTALQTVHAFAAEIAAGKDLFVYLDNSGTIVDGATNKKIAEMLSRLFTATSDGRPFLESLDRIHLFIFDDKVIPFSKVIDGFDKAAQSRALNEFAGRPSNAAGKTTDFRVLFEAMREHLTTQPSDRARVVLIASDLVHDSTNNNEKFHAFVTQARSGKNAEQEAINKGIDGLKPIFDVESAVLGNTMVLLRVGTTRPAVGYWKDFRTYFDLNPIGRRLEEGMGAQAINYGEVQLNTQTFVDRFLAAYNARRLPPLRIIGEPIAQSDGDGSGGSGGSGGYVVALRLRNEGLMKNTLVGVDVFATEGSPSLGPASASAAVAPGKEIDARVRLPFSVTQYLSGESFYIALRDDAAAKKSRVRVTLGRPVLAVSKCSITADRTDESSPAGIPKLQMKITVGNNGAAPDTMTEAHLTDGSDRTYETVTNLSERVDANLSQVVTVPFSWQKVDEAASKGRIGVKVRGSAGFTQVRQCDAFSHGKLTLVETAWKRSGQEGKTELHLVLSNPGPLTAHFKAVEVMGSIERYNMPVSRGNDVFISPNSKATVILTLDNGKLAEHDRFAVRLTRPDDTTQLLENIDARSAVELSCTAEATAYDGNRSKAVIKATNPGPLPIQVKEVKLTPLTDDGTSAIEFFPKSLNDAEQTIDQGQDKLLNIFVEQGEEVSLFRAETFNAEVLDRDGRRRCLVPLPTPPATAFRIEDVRFRDEGNGNIHLTFSAFNEKGPGRLIRNVLVLGSQDQKRDARSVEERNRFVPAHDRRIFTIRLNHANAFDRELLAQQELEIGEVPARHSTGNSQLVKVKVEYLKPVTLEAPVFANGGRTVTLAVNNNNSIPIDISRLGLKNSAGEPVLLPRDVMVRIPPQDQGNVDVTFDTNQFAQLRALQVVYVDLADAQGRPIPIKDSAIELLRWDGVITSAKAMEIGGANPHWEYKIKYTLTKSGPGPARSTAPEVVLERPGAKGRDCEREVFPLSQHVLKDGNEIPGSHVFRSARDKQCGPADNAKIIIKSAAGPRFGELAIDQNPVRPAFMFIPLAMIGFVGVTAFVSKSREQWSVVKWLYSEISPSREEVSIFGGTFLSLMMALTNGVIPGQSLLDYSTALALWLGVAIAAVFGVGRAWTLATEGDYLNRQPPGLEPLSHVRRRRAFKRYKIQVLVIVFLLAAAYFLVVPYSFFGQ